MRFDDRLREASRRNQSLLCVGLDPELQRFPTHLRNDANALFSFCAAIMEATADLAAAFKPNIAFFEAYGLDGIAALKQLAALPRQVPLILDAKRGDIGSTAEAYARAVFNYFDADAVTLNPYLGGDSLEPFLRHSERGCFILCKTSNPGSGDVQDQLLVDGHPLYLEVARRARDDWNTHRNVGLVVGATHPAALAEVRAVCPSLPLLVPGVGSQGGELGAATRAAIDSLGEGVLINASRSIMYAGSGLDFATAARIEALRLRDAINLVRSSVV